MSKKVKEPKENKKATELPDEETETAGDQAPKKVPKRLIKTVVILLAIVLVVFLILKVGFSNDKGVIFSNSGLTMTDPQASLGTVDNSSGRREFANNGTLKLDYSPVDDLFVITDLRTGQSFRSWPEPLEGEYRLEFQEENWEEVHFITGNSDNDKLQDRILTSPVMVGYTKSGQDGRLVMGINQMKHEKTVNQIENGVQLYYYIPELELGFYVELTLSDNGLVAKIPRNGIQEKSLSGDDDNVDRIPRLASLTVLQYLGCARQDDKGYFVVPDGSGALTHFDQAHIATTSEYLKKVYGVDITFDSSMTPDYSSLAVSMPVYGIIREQSMISSFVLAGEANAAIKMGAPGVRNVPFYSLGFQFYYRQYFYSQLSKSSEPYQRLEAAISVGDVSQVFYFDTHAEDSEEDPFDYVDLATLTREYLLQKWGNEKKLAEHVESMYLKIFMGTENTFGSFFSSVKTMTTFEQVREIYEDLEAQGVTNLHLSLLGWQKMGYYGNITKKFNPDGSFGGKSGMKDLLSWAEEKGLTLSLDNNLLLLYSAPRTGISLRDAVVKEPGTEYLNFQISNSVGMYRRGTEFYVMSPLYYNTKVLKEEIEKLQSYGVKNVDLQSVGDFLFTDYNKQNALLRSQTKDLYEEWLKAYQEAFDLVSIYYGNDYAVAGADLILDIPTTSSGHIFLDETVPFLQIVYHGMVDYYAGAVNRASNEKEAFLRTIEYGAFFTYEITYENTSELKYTYYADLFRSQYSNLKDEIVEAYRVAEELLQDVRSANITGHYRLDASKEVYCTEYSDGTKVYVNYEESPYTVNDGVTVEALDYFVAK